MCWFKFYMMSLIARYRHNTSVRVTIDSVRININTYPTKMQI